MQWFLLKYLFICVIFIYLFVCFLFFILRMTGPLEWGLYGFSLFQVYHFILRLYYLEWRLLFLKLSSCKTPSLGNIVWDRKIAPLSILNWKRQSVVCFKVLLSIIFFQGLRKMRNFGITNLRTKNGIG
jgi:hypothetical protein